MRPKVPKIFKSVRYMLAGVNSLFLLTGILLILTGAVILVQYSDYEELLTKRFYTIPSFIIATGVIICLVSVLGFYGAISEQFYFIAAYVAGLLVVLVFEIAIVVASLGIHSDAVQEIRAPMVESLRLYGNRIEVARTWDNLQSGFECCGVASRVDWGELIPVSCCHIDYGTVSPFTCTAANAYTVGCATTLGGWLGRKAHTAAVIGIVVTCLQVLISVAAGWLAWRSKYEEVELES